MVSPYELLYTKSPDYTLFRSFGCLCFPCLRPYNKHKLQYRSTSCIFLGYNSSHKGYLCLDPLTNHIYTTRHVVFDESSFPILTVVVSSSSHSQYVTPAILPPSTTSPMSLLPNPPPTPDSPLPITSTSPSLPSFLPNSDPPMPTLNQIGLPISDTADVFALVQVPETSNRHSMVTRAKSGIRKPKVFLAEKKINPHLPPRSYKSALAIPHWKEAMQVELQALSRNNTWCLVPRPPNITL